MPSEEEQSAAAVRDTMVVCTESKPANRIICGRQTASDDGEERTMLRRSEKGTVLKEKTERPETDDEIQGKENKFGPRVVQAPL